MVRGIGRILAIEALAMELASMRTHEDFVIVGPRQDIDPGPERIYGVVPSYAPPCRQPAKEPFALRHELGPGECRYRPTGNKRSRRRRKG